MNQKRLHEHLFKAFQRLMDARAELNHASTFAKDLPYPQQVTLGECQRMLGYWTDWVENMVSSTATKEGK